MNKDKKSNKRKTIISIIILLIIIIIIILISVFACKPKSKNTQQLEIVGQKDLEGEIDFAGQSNEYVAKYNNEIIEDCEWSLETPNDHITFDNNTNTINWTNNITINTYQLILSAKKDGYKTCNFDIQLIITLPKLHIIGQNVLHGSFNHAFQSAAYLTNDTLNNNVDNCSWTLSSTIPGISFDETAHKVSWDDNIAADNYFFQLKVEKSGYTFALLDIELIIFDNYFVWDDSGTLRKVNINMEIQDDRFFCKLSSASSRQFKYCYSVSPSSSIIFDSFDSDTDNIRKVTKINFKLPEVIDDSLIDSSRGFMSDFCCKMINLTECNIIMPKIVPDNVGDNFMFRAFSECDNLTELNNDFMMPTNYSQIGQYFLNSVFKNSTSLKKLPKGFVLPKILDASNASYFMSEAFSNCHNLLTINSSFVFPTLNIINDIQITDFCKSTFLNCEKLDLGLLPNENTIKFNYASNITPTVNSNFCSKMFQNCYELTTLPDNFNLPSQITKVGYNFCSQMFENCNELTTLPDNFNLPSQITEVDYSFCQEMFKNCTSLTQTPNGRELIIPNPTGTIPANFCEDMFTGCTYLDISPIVPGDTRMIARNS